MTYAETRADENTGGALLQFPMRTDMHGKSRVSSAISVCDNQKNFKIGFSTVTAAQLVRPEHFKVFVSLYYARFLISLSPFPVVFVEGRRLLLRRLKRPPGVYAWARVPNESIARLQRKPSVFT